MVIRFFRYIFSQSNTILFLSAFFLSISLTASFLYLASEQPDLLFKDIDGDFYFSKLTLLGKFFTFSGIFPNFLYLILIFRFIIFCLKPLGKILMIIFSNKNLDKFNEYVTKLEKTLIKNKPKVNKAFNKIKLKKKIKKDYLMPLSIIISAIILAFAILFQ